MGQHQLTSRKILYTYIMRSRSLLIELSRSGSNECFWVSTCKGKIIVSMGSKAESLQLHWSGFAVPSNFFFSFAGRCALFACCSMLSVKRYNTSTDPLLLLETRKASAIKVEKTVPDDGQKISSNYFSAKAE